MTTHRSDIWQKASTILFDGSLCVARRPYGAQQVPGHGIANV